MQDGREGHGIELYVSRHRLLASQQQQLVDALRQLPRCACDISKRKPVIGNRFIDAAQGDFSLAQNGGRRRAQFVAQVGKQLTPSGIRGLQLSVGVGELGSAFIHRRFQPAIFCFVLQPGLMNFQRHGIKTLRQLTELVPAALRNSDGLHSGRLLFFYALRAEQEIFKGLFELPDEIIGHRQRRGATQHHHDDKYDVAPPNHCVGVGVSLLAQA